MARLLMNAILRQGGYPSVAMLSELSYSRAVSSYTFSEFLKNRVCTTARLIHEQGDSYGQDVASLAQKCIQKTKKYYLDAQQDEADPVPECQNSFRFLLADYENTRDEL